MRWKYCFEVIIHILLLVFISLFFLRPIESEDVWWHLATGNDIVQSHAIPHFDPFDPTENTTIITTTHHWLGSVVIYDIYKFFGISGLRIFRDFFFFFILGVFYVYARRKIPSLLLSFLIFVLVFGLGLRTQMRPDLFNIIFSELLIFLLLNSSKRLKSWRLVLIPILGVFWCNIHLGCFIYGVLILSVFCLQSIVELIQSKKEDKDFKTCRDLLLCFIFFIASFFVNPYGLDGFLYPLRTFIDPNFRNFYETTQYIEEVSSPKYIFSLSGLWFHLLFFVSCLLIWKNKKRNFAVVILFCFSLFMFLYSQRNSSFFVIVSGILIVQSLVDLKITFAWDKFSSMSSNLLSIVFIGVILGNIIHTVNKKCYIDQQWHKRMTLELSPLVPQKTVDLFLENNFQGLVFNSDIYGGYLLWKTFPKIKPFVDGRQLNKENWEIYRQVISFPEMYWAKAEEKFRFNFVLLDGHNPVFTKFIEYIRNDSSWQLISVEGFSILFVKRGTVVIPDILNNYEDCLKSITMDKAQFKIIEHASMQKQSFLSPGPFFMDNWEEGMIQHRLGFKTAGFNQMMEAVLVYPTVHNIKVLEFLVAEEMFNQKK